MRLSTKWMFGLVVAGTVAACDVEKTEEGEMPKVDVEGGQLPEYKQTQEGEMPDIDVEGGELPEYDVDAPDVDVGTEEKRVTVPDVDIDEDSRERKRD